MDTPYDSETVGFTAAAIEILCQELGICLHVKWGNTKLVSFTTDSEYEPVLLEVWSDHAYFLNALPKEFLKAEAQELSCKREDIVAGLKRKPTDLPASQ